MADERDPTVVRVLVVRPDDLVAARQANLEGDGRATLRVTPPFSGRMRARLHRTVDGGATPGPEPVEVAPADLLAEDAPDYPHPDDTGDELRADPDAEYTRERHRRRHERAVSAWRASLSEHVADRTTLDTAEGPHEVGVTLLGG